MTDYLKLAEECGGEVFERDDEMWAVFVSRDLVRFAARVRAEERERCAGQAWIHFMDVCKARGIPPADFGHWIASDSIRTLPEQPQ